MFWNVNLEFQKSNFVKMVRTEIYLERKIYVRGVNKIMGRKSVKIRDCPRLTQEKKVKFPILVVFLILLGTVCKSWVVRVLVPP